MGNNITLQCPQSQLPFKDNMDYGSNTSVKTNNHANNVPESYLSSTNRRQKIFDQTNGSLLNFQRSLILTQFHQKIEVDIGCNKENQNDDVESIVIHPPQKEMSKHNVNIFELITPTPRTESNDSELLYLWKAAAKEQQEDIKKSKVVPETLKNQKVVMKQDDGSTYSGGLFKGQKHGVGRLVDMEGRTVYDGDWRLGKWHGNGIQYFWEQQTSKVPFIDFNQIKANPTSRKFIKQYVGEFEDDLHHGSGEIIYKNNSRLYGQFSQGYPDGICSFECSEKKLTTQSLWKGGKFIRQVYNAYLRN